MLLPTTELGAERFLGGAPLIRGPTMLHGALECVVRRQHVYPSPVAPMPILRLQEQHPKECCFQEQASTVAGTITPWSGRVRLAKGACPKAPWPNLRVGSYRHPSRSAPFPKKN